MNYDFQSIIDYIVIISPTIASVLGIIVGFLKLVKNGKDNNKQIKKQVEELQVKFDENRLALENKNAELKDELLAVLKDNAELKAQNEEIKSILTGERRG